MGTTIRLNLLRRFFLEQGFTVKPDTAIRASGDHRNVGRWTSVYYDTLEAVSKALLLFMKDREISIEVRTEKETVRIEMPKSGSEIETFLTERKHSTIHLKAKF